MIMERFQETRSMTMAHLYIVPMCAVLSSPKQKKGSAVADYRFSAQVIKRSSGRSATAAAAYRASVHLNDERTGERHDYSRKGGTLHTEIMTPDNTPEWMCDRAQLWNAVEKVERRKDAQLAREVQLSLPHELTQEQRLELVRGFVADEFINRGMVADIAIHAPHEAGDERNHHAHIMLTMRELVPDGFGNKNRDWNSREVITNWREQWANHQNRALKRHNHPERVDHRSYEEQGIDREPTQHRGVAANEMEKRGEPTRIGDKNRNIETRNAEQAKRLAYEAVLFAQVSMERSKVDTWANNERKSFKERLRAKEVDIQIRHRKERETLNGDLKKSNDAMRKNILSQLNTVSFRLENASGARKIIRSLLGHTKADTHTQNELKKALQAVKVSEQTKHTELDRKQENELSIFKERATDRNQTLENTIADARSQTNKNKPNFLDSLRSSYNRSATQANENTKEHGRKQEKERGIERKPE